MGTFDCACGRGESEGHQDAEVLNGAGDGLFDGNYRQGKGRGGLPAEAYVVLLRGTVRLAEDNFGPDPPALVPVLAF